MSEINRSLFVFVRPCVDFASLYLIMSFVVGSVIADVYSASTGTAII